MFTDAMLAHVAGDLDTAERVFIEAGEHLRHVGGFDAESPRCSASPRCASRLAAWATWYPRYNNIGSARHDRRGPASTGWPSRVI